MLILVFQICKRDNTDMLVLQSKRKRIEDTTKMYSKLRNSFDFLISLLSNKSMWQVLDMFFYFEIKNRLFL